MEQLFYSEFHDLITPDGAISSVKKKEDGSVEAVVTIANISPCFRGFFIDPSFVFFNFKSTLAQLGLNGIGEAYHLDKKNLSAEILVHIYGVGPIASKMIPLLTEGAYIGKLFAAEERRRVRDPDYLSRFFGRSDRHGRPLLSLGGFQGSSDLILEKVEGRTIAYLSLREGVLCYDEAIFGLLPTLAKALKKPHINLRPLLRLLHVLKNGQSRIILNKDFLLVRTLPLHIRTVFGKVVDELLPQGYHHTSACILDPNTYESGDIYELYGSSGKELSDIPLEFYTLEPYREHVFFSDRDQLQECLETPSPLFNAFETPNKPTPHPCATFIVKGEQLLNLTEKEWIFRDPKTHEFPGLIHPGRQALMAERYIQQQPSYPFFKAIEEDRITSQGILLTRYFPSPLMKKMLLSDAVQSCLKGIYFQIPSYSHGDFFSHEDRSLLLDLAKFAIPVFWVDKRTEKVLQYVPKPGKDVGMFVPLFQIENFLKATAFGVYGSNLLKINCEEELTALMKGILKMREILSHPLLNKETPITLVTGGGPGVMELGNRIAKSLNILSCANIADFRPKPKGFVTEQTQNPFIDAKMTYRIDRLIERQGEFNLDFPIFVMGGIGTDFEFSLEEVRRKTGSSQNTPVLLFGSPDYWRNKITSRFQCNLKNKTIAGSEWVSNCFYCVENAAAALKVYEHFFEGRLPIGPQGPVYQDGFAVVT
ncbi:MAG: hypothetical protein A2Y28_01290 [Chlamydiae bacterium GWC2_50_10]|nr:MAG: hypothetical protein A2Z85_01335 [Chlamydiae bacterium GWA2_50_15]OGN53826.1 MAG: hypothetical protein A2Y28_01290 [Chlamydiae bacterium GWC2_50_10]OGN58343.1 MAG: hypothetical protein A3D18_00290 [Chlamydiae bacterium RIFCSPHIGHO2_02_FULL_49_29]OGN68206.1 MAG: hypothetical protein A3I15_04985 [Chlamydiae bacterium RIFCSPLOWO2_02_FULL_49_12]OGN72899.1 MAG: hypothetical protein A3G30_01810 [Chlamydiae bacterium RIFCSPLOWO2_12_FULL_49_12]HAZ15140.1 hypothetical protein [Parachlamydiales 